MRLCYKSYLNLIINKDTLRSPELRIRVWIQSLRKKMDPDLRSELILLKPTFVL